MGFGFCTGYQKVKRFIDVLKRIAFFFCKNKRGHSSKLKTLITENISLAQH